MVMSPSIRVSMPVTYASSSPSDARLVLLPLLFLGRDLAFAAEVVLRGRGRSGWRSDRRAAGAAAAGAADFGAAAAVGAAACAPSVTRS